MNPFTKTLTIIACSAFLFVSCSNKRYPNSDTKRANPEATKYEPMRDRDNNTGTNTPGHQNREIRKNTPAK